MRLEDREALDRAPDPAVGVFVGAADRGPGLRKAHFTPGGVPHAGEVALWLRLQIQSEREEMAVCVGGEIDEL